MIDRIAAVNHGEGIGFLMAQGYNVPINLTTVVVGINSVVNALELM